jgi:hypothetical protein
MTNAYFTWLGPPQQASKVVNDIPGLQRPDLFGILRTARATFVNNPPPRFKLCVLKKFEAAFRAELGALGAAYIDVIAVEEQFATNTFHSIVMREPNLDDLGLMVDFILRETIGVRGTGYSNDLLPYRKLAFAKDLWSLYCLWRFGGYHIDCGCFPDQRSPQINLPEPTEFGVVALTPEGTFAGAHHASVRFPRNPMCSTLSVSEASPLRGLALQGLVSARGDGRSPLTRTLDVWLLRSTAGHPAAKKALEFYILGWFAIRNANLGIELTSQALRELVVSAVCTGVTHGGRGDGCSERNNWKTYMIDAVSVADPYVPSIGVRKIGFQSHRA